MTKKIFLCALTLIFAALVFAACQSEAECRVAAVEGGTEYTVIIRLHEGDETLLNASARENGVKRTVGTVEYPWTVTMYLAQAIQAATDFSRKMELEHNPPSGYSMMVFRLVVPLEEEAEEEEEAAGYGSRHLENAGNFFTRLFVRTYEHRMPNPFRAAYHDAPVGSVGDVFKNGLIGTDPDQSIPAFSDAFPIVKDHPSYDPGSLNVKYTFFSSGRYNVSGDDEKKGSNFSGYRYTFNSKLGAAGDTELGDIVFTYIRPNGTGWYLTAILAGGLAIGVVLLIAFLRNKAKSKKNR